MQTAHIMEKAGSKQKAFSRLVSIGLLALLPVTTSAQHMRLPIDVQPIEKPIVKPVDNPIVVEHPTFEPHPITVQKISDVLRLPVHDLRILGGRQVTLPYLGTQLELYKVLDAKTGDSHHVALDSSGAQVDYEALQQEDRALRYQKYGSMQVALHDLVESGAPGTIPVLIKLNVAEKAMPPVQPSSSPTKATMSNGITGRNPRARTSSP